MKGSDISHENIKTLYPSAHLLHERGYEPKVNILPGDSGQICFLSNKIKLTGMAINSLIIDTQKISGRAYNPSSS